MDVVDVYFWVKSHSTYLWMALPLVLAIVVVKVLKA
jgi:hypothetical protein